LLSFDSIRLNTQAAAFSHDFDTATITVVLGRNASGKTLLARIVAGLERPAAGRLLLDNRDLTDEPPGKRSVALVNQAFVNYPHWTVARNIASPMVAAGAEPGAIEDKVVELARQLQLDGLLNRLPESLSGGQQQRLAIGRALAKGATVLVMDEPLVNLDFKLRETLMLELRTLLHDQQLTVIYTSSDPRDAFAMGDEVVLLADHTLVQAGEPLDVYERPCSPVAADLMSDPGVNRRHIEGRLLLVRPEHLHLQRGDKQDHAFSAVVMSRETNGSETFLHCEVAGAHWVARLDGLVDVADNETITLYAAAQSVLEFADG
jgi:glycerol transport system ATP-binding protein